MKEVFVIMITVYSVVLLLLSIIMSILDYSRHTFSRRIYDIIQIIFWSIFLPIHIAKHLHWKIKYAND